MKILVLLAATAIAELWLLLAIGRVIGLWATVGLLVGSAALGVSLAKREGFRVLTSWQEAVAGGRAPDEGLLSAALVLLGAVLLGVPGVLTDLAGLLLLFPPTRRALVRAVRGRFERQGAAVGVAEDAGIDGGGGFFRLQVVELGGDGWSAGEEMHGGRAGRGAAEVIDVEAEVTEMDGNAEPKKIAGLLPR
jgi:UPF0716 protein FxsA